MPSKVQSQVISSVLKQKFNENKENVSSNVSLSQLQGRPLQIQFKNTKDNSSLKRPLLSVNDMANIQTNLNLSNRKINSIASALRVASCNRKVIESGLKTKLATKAHSLDNFFDYKDFEFVRVKGKEISADAKVVVYCSNLQGFLEYVQNQRYVTNPVLKLGIDGGGGFLKICLLIQTQTNEIKQSKRSTYNEGISAKKFKDSGVKKLFILSIAPNSQENYENVDQLWSELRLNSFEGTIATDLKIANILAGIMSHSSTYPCTWYHAKKGELHKCSTLRSPQNTLENYEKWRGSGAIKDKAKNFFNCVNPPLFMSEKDKVYLDIIPPPELHLMLGVVNTLFSHMLKDYETESLAWAKACYAEREITYGAPAFKGNSCKKLLNNVDILRSMKNIGVIKYVTVFNDFKMLYLHASGMILTRITKNT